MTSHSLLGGMQNTTAIEKTVGQFLIKLNTILSYDSITMFLSTYPTYLKTYVYNKHSHVKLRNTFIPNC